MPKLPVWYRHRIVKRLLLPGTAWWERLGRRHLTAHPDVVAAKATLRQQADTEMSLYLRGHFPGQVSVTEFIKPCSTGMEVFVALTLYGPPSMEDEIISELTERGEA